MSKLTELPQLSRLQDGAASLQSSINCNVKDVRFLCRARSCQNSQKFNLPYLRADGLDSSDMASQALLILRHQCPGDLGQLVSLLLTYLRRIFMCTGQSAGCCQP